MYLPPNYKKAVSIEEAVEYLKSQDKKRVVVWRKWCIRCAGNDSVTIDTWDPCLVFGRFNRDGSVFFRFLNIPVTKSLRRLLRFFHQEEKEILIQEVLES